MTALPRPWPEVPLRAVCEFRYGKALPKTVRAAGGTVPVFGSNGVVGTHNEPLTKGPTIVIGRKGSLGEVNFSPVPCWPIDTTYFVDNTSTDADLRWLAYRLNGLGLTGLNRAAAVPGLNREDAYRLRLSLPPPSDQRRIAEVLDRADALRAKRRAALGLLDTLNQSTFLDLFGDPVANPKNWQLVQLEDVLDRIESGWSPTCLDRPVIDGEWGVLKLGAVTKNSYDPSQNKAVPENVMPLPELEVKKGDLLFSRKNTYELVAACALVLDTPSRLMMPDLIFRLCLRSSGGIDAAFLHQMLVYPTKRRVVQQLAGGSSGSMPNISKGRLLRLPIVKPPLPLQQTFARRVAAVEKLKAAHRASLAQLDALFASLQHRAFRGEL